MPDNIASLSKCELSFPETYGFCPCGNRSALQSTALLQLLSNCHTTLIIEGKKYFILQSLVLKADKIISAPNFPPYYSQVIAGWHSWTQQGVGSYHEQCRENVLVTVSTLTAPEAATIIMEIRNKSHSNVAFNSTIKGEHTKNHPSLSSIHTQGYCRKISQH